METQVFQRRHLESMVQSGTEWFSDHPAIDFNEESIQHSRDQLLTLYKAGVLHGCVLMEDEDVVGALLAITSPEIFTPETRMYEIIFYIEPYFRSMQAARDLVSNLKEQAAELGVRSLIVGAQSGYETKRVCTLYRRLGFEELGHTFIMKL